MHSSRMHTVRSSSCLLLWCLLGGVCPGGVCQRGCLPKGCLPGGCIPVCNGADIPHVDRMTVRCKNITFPQLRLRMVIRILALQTCACDHEVLIGYQSNSFQAQCMIPAQPSEKVFHCWEVQYSKAVMGETVLSHWTALYATVINSIL